MDEGKRLIEISKTMPDALRRRQLPTMGREGWDTIKVVCVTIPDYTNCIKQSATFDSLSTVKAIIRNAGLGLFQTAGV